LRDDTPMA